MFAMAGPALFRLCADQDGAQSSIESDLVEPARCPAPVQARGGGGLVVLRDSAQSVA
ncbi:hypothetical protein DESC_970015 [Desulfosarcina cetonica]|nr:hypothetical protein DESC_970015 [Desulfosarcina cetonica]